MQSLILNAMNEDIVAMADPDPKVFGKLFEILKGYGHGEAINKIRLFSCYTEMLDKMSSELDAVIIATTNLHHAPASIMAMQKGIHVYVEKPMAFSFADAEAMKIAARKYGVATQVGNQGHNNEQTRIFAEYLASGVLGEIKDIWCWTDRVNAYASKPPVISVPKGFNWEAYRGPAKNIEYRETMHPHGWHAWHEIGNGSIGNMATHIFDPFMWGLDLGAPKSVEMIDNTPGGDGSWDISSTFQWEFPATDKRGAIRMHWFDGLKPGLAYDSKYIGSNDQINESRWANRPPIVEELEKKYGVDLGATGGVVVGKDGALRIGSCGGLNFAPLSFKKKLGPIPKIFPREKHMDHMKDFFVAARGGRPAACNFEYSEPLAKIVLSGNLASLAGKGKKIAL